MARFKGTLASAKGRRIALIRGEFKKSATGWTGTFRYPADAEEKLAAPNPYLLRIEGRAPIAIKLTIVGIGEGPIQEAHFHAGVEKAERRKKSEA